MAVSKTENKTLMLQARESLKGMWGLAVGVTIVYILIAMIAGSIPRIGFLISLIITGPLVLGYAIFILAVSRKQNPAFAQLFDGFKRFVLALQTYILQAVFILLWTLLLIIPGIIAALSYSMAFFLLVDNENIKPMEAINKSKELMKGNKGKLFCLGLRFLGWIILGIVTLGIGFLWILPYMAVSVAKFYDDILKPAGE